MQECTTGWKSQRRRDEKAPWALKYESGSDLTHLLDNFSRSTILGKRSTTFGWAIGSGTFFGRPATLQLCSPSTQIGRNLSLSKVNSRTPLPAIRGDLLLASSWMTEQLKRQPGAAPLTDKLPVAVPLQYY